MKNNSRSPVTEMLSGKYKIWLMVGLAIMLAVDCIACGVLIYRDSSGYLFIPVAMTIIDALYLAAVAFSNQRFMYAKTLFIVYIAFTAVCCVLWGIADMRTTIFTNAAAAMWIILHLTSACAAIISYIYAAKRIRGGRTIQLILAVLFSCVAVLGCGVYYGIQLFTDGYFGQGSGVRPLRYEYYADNTCAVVGVVNGNEKNIVVPYEFNGSKVVEVSSLVLDDGVKNITFECDPDVTLFRDMGTVGALNYDVNIYVDKNRVDSFKKKLYEMSFESGTFYAAFDLGNRVRPTGLNKDEVYVTFDYDIDAYTYGREKIIPTWYGKKGDVFNLSKFTSVDYALNSDIRDDAQLYWSYNHNSGRVMSALEYKNTNLNGAPISENCYNVPVRFQKVFPVYVGAGNDDVYDPKEHFDFSVVNDRTLDYKLTVADIANELLVGFERGDGFVREMRYYRDGYNEQTSTGTTFSSLSSVLTDAETEAGFNEVTIAPYWALVQPEVKISTLDDKTEIVYGDAFSLNADVTHPLDDIRISYEWYTGGVRRGYEQKYTENKITYVGTREYMVTATVSAPTVTSLSTANAANIHITSSKRPLTAVWTDPASNVYDGTVKIISLAFENAVDGDEVYPFTSTYTQRNVSSYTYSALISGADATKYYVASGNEHTYAILPRPVALEWDNYVSFEYDGFRHLPYATAVDIDGDPLNVTYTLEGNTGITGVDLINVGEYTVFAHFSDYNYTPDTTDDNDRRKITIYPMQIDVVWGAADLTFDGNYQAPTASAKGAKGADVSVTVSGRQLHANLIGGEIKTPYTATAKITEGNYKLNPDTVEKTFTIKPFEVTVTWYDTTLTYNGEPQAPRPYAMGVNANLSMTLTGQETNVGDDYTVTAAIDSTDYVITSGESQKYSIVPYTLKVTWSNDVFTYDGYPHNPTVTATGVNGVNVPISVTSAPQTNADTYTATAGVTDYNYTIANANRTHSFTINKRNITVSWINTQLTYNGDNQAPTPKLLYAVGEPEFTVTGQEKNASKNYSYTARIELNDNNHHVSQGASCVYSISPMSVAVEWGNLNLTYNGQYQVPTASVTGAKGETIELHVTSSWTGKYVVGSYVAAASFETPNANYELTGDTTKGYNIIKQKINVTVRDVTVTQGYPPEYDFDYDGVVDGDVAYLFCGIEGENDANLAIGTYDITVYLYGTDCGNYELNIVRHGRLTVTAQGV